MYYFCPPGMVRFTTTIKRFASQGEKTGWTYIEVPADLADELSPGNKKGFRVKGRLDKYPFKGIALIPMGKKHGGTFILTLNATIRKNIGKKSGAMLDVQLELDKSVFKMNADFMECLADEPQAKSFFNSLSGSHQRYFSKWIDAAKTVDTKSKRIAMAVSGLAKKWDFGLVLRKGKPREQ
jgi:hypothetical protein